MYDSSLVPASLSELEAIEGGSDWWTSVKCALMPWREVIDGMACEGLR